MESEMKDGYGLQKEIHDFPLISPTFARKCGLWS